MSSSTFDMSQFLERLQHDRYPVYQWLQQNAPILPEPTTGKLRSFTTWHLTRYDDVMAVLRDNRFVHEVRNYLDPSEYADPPESIKALADSQRNWMLFKDPPDHTRLRSLVSRAFTPKMVDGLRPRIEQMADELLDDMKQSRDADVVRDYAFPLPVMMIAELLGVPMKDRDRFRAWSNVLFQSLDLTADETVWEAASEAVTGLRNYLRDIVQERASHPQEDLISAMVRAREDGESLTEDELLDNCILMLSAGHETTVNLIANAIYLLMTHEDQFVRLQADWSLAGGAIEETLRYESPIQVTQRFIREDVELGSVTLKKGDYVNPWLGAANRDAARYENPDVFDITREVNRHASFGQGIHFCLGAPLARLEGVIALERFFNRFPHVQFANETPFAWRDSILTRSLEYLQVRVEG